MSRKAKLVREFRNATTEFPWEDFCRLLSQLGFQENRRGKTAGSRRKFAHSSTGMRIYADEPHDGVMRKSMIKRLRSDLEARNLL